MSATFRLNAHEEQENREKTLELLKLVGLEGLKDDLATSLPYGKQSRLEIARALATEPSLLLLDAQYGQGDQAAEHGAHEAGEYVVRDKHMPKYSKLGSRRQQGGNRLGYKAGPAIVQPSLFTAPRKLPTTVS